MEDYRKSATIYFTISVIAYIASVILFVVGNEPPAVIALCLGSSNLCMGAMSYRKSKDQK